MSYLNTRLDILYCPHIPSQNLYPHKHPIYHNTHETRIPTHHPWTLLAGQLLPRRKHPNRRRNQSGKNPPIQRQNPKHRPNPRTLRPHRPCKRNRKPHRCGNLHRRVRPPIPYRLRTVSFHPLRLPPDTHTGKAVKGRRRN